MPGNRTRVLLVKATDASPYRPLKLVVGGTRQQRTSCHNSAQAIASRMTGPCHSLGQFVHRPSTHLMGDVGRIGLKLGIRQSFC